MSARTTGRSRAGALGRALSALVVAAAIALGGAPARAAAPAQTAPHAQENGVPSPPSAAADLRPFVSGAAGHEWLRRVWSDGTVMAVAGYHDVRITCRSGQVSYGPSLKIRGITALAGGGVGEALTIAAVGEEGGVLAWSRGRWEVVQAPAIEREALTAAAVDDAGRIYAAGERHALYVRDGDAWAIHRYPRGEAAQATVRAMVRVGDLGLLLAGDGGLLLTFKDGALRRTALPAGALSGDLQAAWAGEGGAVVWLISTTDLIRVDMIRGLARGVDVPSFGQVRALAGVSTPRGDRLVVAAQSELSLHDGQRFLRVAGEYVFAEGLAIDGHDGSIYVASRDGLRRVVVDEPGLRALQRELGPPRPCPLPGEATASAATEGAAVPTAALDAGGSSTGADRSSPAATDTTTPTAALTPIEPERRRPRTHMPSLRLSMGPALVADPAGGVRAAFALDLFLGAQLGVRPRLAIWPEMGYAHSRSPISGGHLIAAGVGPLYGGKAAGIAVMPKLMIGSAGDRFAFGVRSSLVGTFLLDLLSLELGHQWLRVGDQDVHEGRLMFSVNALPLLAVFLVAGAIRSFRRPFRRR